MTTSKGSIKEEQKRSLMAFDLSRAWAEALREVAKKHYPAETSPTAMVRRVVQDIVRCFMSEQELRERGLLAEYEPKPGPHLLLHAINYERDHGQDGHKKGK